MLISIPVLVLIRKKRKTYKLSAVSLLGLILTTVTAFMQWVWEQESQKTMTVLLKKPKSYFTFGITNGGSMGKVFPVAGGRPMLFVTRLAAARPIDTRDQAASPAHAPPVLAHSLPPNSRRPLQT